MIYPVDSAIQLVNNLGLFFKYRWPSALIEYEKKKDGCDTICEFPTAVQGLFDVKHYCQSSICLFFAFKVIT